MPEKKPKVSYFAQLLENTKMLKEIFQLIIDNKKWWLLPFFFVFATLSLFITLVGGGAVLPAIYAIF